MPSEVLKKSLFAACAKTVGATRMHIRIRASLVLMIHSSRHRLVAKIDLTIGKGSCLGQLQIQGRFDTVEHAATFAQSHRATIIWYSSIRFSRASCETMLPLPRIAIPGPDSFFIFRISDTISPFTSLVLFHEA